MIGELEELRKVFDTKGLERTRAAEDRRLALEERGDYAELEAEEFDWEEELARAIEEDDRIAISAAWEMCYPGSCGDEAVQMLTQWD